MILPRLARWMDTRLRLGKPAREFLNHIFPDHWSFMLGEIALYSFVVLVVTGAFLVMFFNNSAATVVYHGSFRAMDGVRMSAAYRSALQLSFDVPAGLLVRQMHHWASLIFLAAIVAHLSRIFFTGAYRRPREINWIIGLTLLLFALFNGYLGYSMADDLLSGMGVRIAYSIVMSIPLLGPWMAYVFFGGTVPTSATIPRFYGMHIFFVPAIIVGLIGLHLLIIWRQYHTNYPGPGRTDRTIVGSRLWPTYTAKSLGLFCLIVGLIAALGGLVQIDPVWVYGPNNPVAALSGAQPDWYLGWIEGSMRLFPGANLRIGGWLVPELFFSAVLFPALIFLALYLYPFFERWAMYDDEPHNVLKFPYETPVKTAFGCALFALVLVVFFAGSDDVISIAGNFSVTQIRTILRVLFFIAPAVTAILVYMGCRIWRRKRAVLQLE